ncbi:addiction module protein [Arcobacter porcinus]|uniref:Addiction module component n=1 Tax=Arcobacter porcinus TaxID=1935204 RepID=A0ABX2YD50_9BACT|nr:addiction module protein [Arcobacter porcinus]OCL92921.1 putative addiction module component [Arcobacter porcinus]
MSIDEIKKLDVKDRIILMNDIWESLESQNDEIVSPSWHKDILEKRLEKIKQNNATYISLEELKSR